MRRMMRTTVGVLLAISLLIAPVAFAGEVERGWSFGEWVEDVLDDLFGEEAPPEGDDDPGLPGSGPFIDPAG